VAGRNSANSRCACAGCAAPGLGSSPGKSPLETPRPGRSIMFGEGFENCWYKVPGVPSLELSGDLSFRGPQGLRKLRIDCNGRPYVLASKVAGQGSKGRARQGKVMLHRAVISVVLDRQLGRDEFVCHHDDDRRNNWPQNLYIGDYHSNAADSLRNGGRVRGDSHPCTKIWPVSSIGTGNRNRSVIRRVFQSLRGRFRPVFPWVPL
jgi:hypothetical protein